MGTISRRNAQEADGDKRVLPNEDLETYLAFPDAGIKVRWVRRGRGQFAGFGFFNRRDYVFGTDIGTIILRSDVGYDFFWVMLAKDKKGTDVNFEQVFVQEMKDGFVADWCGEPRVGKKYIALKDQDCRLLCLFLQRLREAVQSATK